MFNFGPGNILGGYGGFFQTFRCYPISLLDRSDLDAGGKSNFFVAIIYIYCHSYPSSFSIRKNV
jgi:hypothetical protein